MDNETRRDRATIYAGFVAKDATEALVMLTQGKDYGAAVELAGVLRNAKTAYRDLFKTLGDDTGGLPKPEETSDA